jgi:glycosyltransferase involved in cell wall biosynthesis
LKIAVLTGASLSWNPRALKEATALARAGHDVVVLGSSWDAARFDADRALARKQGFSFRSAIPVSSDGEVPRCRVLVARSKGRIGRTLFRYLKTESSWQIGSLVSDLMNAAVLAQADYYIAHTEQGAWVASKLLRMGRKVGIDMEDWYSEDLLPDARKERPVRLLREVEGALLRGAGHSTCPSRAMSAALAHAYSCSPPSVIYNAFPWSDRDKLDSARKDRQDRQAPSIHWVSQTLGPGRGLEDLFAALPMVRNMAAIHLRGYQPPGLAAWLSANVPQGWAERVFIHDPVGAEELLSRIAEHDIGFAGEMKYSASRDLTITNKVLHYLLSGCAVVASDTAGQKEVAEMAAGAVFLYPSGNAAALAETLNSLLESPDKLSAAKAAALAAARETFCWERQERAFVDVVTRAAVSGTDFAR